MIDPIEKGIITVLPELGKTAGKATGGKPGAMIGGPAADKIGALLFNAESTVGYKSHLLREKNANKTTTIVLEPQRIIILSPSGRNSVPVSSKAAK